MEDRIRVNGADISVGFILSFESEEAFVNEMLSTTNVFIKDVKENRELKLKGIYAMAHAKSGQVQEVVETPKKVNQKSKK